jgi:hypothetical protein
MCGFYFSCNNIILGEKKKWFDKVLLDYWLLYDTKHFVVVCCVVNQIKTFKKMNVKTTWWSKIISNVVKFHLHILIVSCIFNFVCIHPLCNSICCNFVVSNHNLMCYVAFYAHWLLIQSYWHCNCKITIFKLIVWVHL